jgi:hypothetical protein
MKKLKIIFGLLGIVVSTIISAQDFAELKQIPLTDSISCSVAQGKVIECSNFLLNSPCSENLASINAMQFLLGWMGATPTYQFSFEPDFYKAIKSDLYLSGRYFAALAKTAIEKNYYENDIARQFDAITLVLNYCEISKNNVKITKKLQKYIDAKNTNNLKDLIKTN